MDSCELRDKCKLHGTPKIQSFIKFTKTTVVEAGSFMINQLNFMFAFISKVCILIINRDRLQINIQSGIRDICQIRLKSQSSVQWESAKVVLPLALFSISSMKTWPPHSGLLTFKKYMIMDRAKVLGFNFGIQQVSKNLEPQQRFTIRMQKLPLWFTTWEIDNHSRA